MRLIELNPKNVYSCQLCQIEFPAEECTIIQGFFPVCSSRCKFKLIYRILRDNYSNENIKIMFDLLKNSSNRATFSTLSHIEKVQFNRNIALFELSKHFSKFPLSSVIGVFSFLILNNSFSRESHFLNHTLCNRVVEKTKLEKTFENEGELRKWF